MNTWIAQYAASHNLDDRYVMVFQADGEEHAIEQAVDALTPPDNLIGVAEIPRNLITKEKDGHPIILSGRIYSVEHRYNYYAVDEMLVYRSGKVSTLHNIKVGNEQEGCSVAR